MIELKNIYDLETDLERGLARAIGSNQSRLVQEYLVAIINKLTDRVAELEGRAPVSARGKKAESEV